MGGSERTPAQSAKDLGSELYANGDYAAAENAFTEALSLATQVDRSELHIFHSNRCAARMQLANVDGALQDAKKCTELAPRWAKGWSRLGACQAQKGRYSAAEASFRTALSLDPGNETYRAQLSNARAQMRPPESPGGGRGEPPRRSWADRAWAVARAAAVQRWWAGLTGDQRGLLAAGAAVAVLFVAYEVYNSLFGHAFYGDPFYDSLADYGGRWTWSFWILVLIGGWKLPPMFGYPPFFGMSLVHFVWLLQMLQNSSAPRRRYSAPGLYRRRYW
uniref:Carboxylate clamp-tetratricopeptide repeat protein n=1 Tax=Tetraselmis sp. GSL018 TaxID=582737 RepID=A0A061RK11_9CHLO